MNTSTQQGEKRGPGRPRKDEVQERRRRRPNVGPQALRMGVNEALLDRDKFVYRWINDTPGRILNKASPDYDDWAIVMNSGGEVKADATDLGDAVSIVTGGGQNGGGMRVYLCRKPRKYWEEDQAAKAAALDEHESQLRSGNDRSGNSQSDYVPSAGISIGRS